MTDGDDGLTWWLGDDDPKAGTRTMWVTIVLFATPGIAILFAGVSGPGSGMVWAIMAGFLLLGIALGIGSLRRDRRSISSITFAPGSGTFSVRRIDDSTDTYPVAAVESVRVTRSSDHETVSLRLSIGGKTLHTRSGPAESAEPLLGLFAETGAKITTKVLTPD